MLIAVIGDCLLDITVRPSGPMRPGADAPAAIRLSPGGQGANVAVRLARRGASVRLIAALGDDLVGKLLRDALDADGVALVPLPAERSGSVAVLLDAAGERSMLSDRVRASSVEALPELLADADWIHASGYVLRDEHAHAMAVALGARADGVRLSVGGGSLPPEGATAFAEHLRAARPDLLILSRDEAAGLGSFLDHGADTLAVTTAGAAGSSARLGGQTFEIPAPVLDDPVLDATGAGDAYAAALVDTLAHLGQWPPPPVELRSAMQAASLLGAETARVDGAQGRVPSEGGDGT